MDAFDADALIYAAVPNHPLGRRVAALFPSGPLAEEANPAGVGSLLLLPELLTKPTRDGMQDELNALTGFLARLDLRPIEPFTAELAVALGATYRLPAADALHLATAVQVGADRFVTSNERHFPKTISEVAITYPADLTDPASAEP